MGAKVMPQKAQNWTRRAANKILQKVKIKLKFFFF